MTIHNNNNNTGEEALPRLRLTPIIAWPTLLILLGGLAAIALSWTMVLIGAWPWWLGMVLNSIAGYTLFTPAHEAIHRCAARNPKLNDFILATATFVAVPFGKGTLFRLYHMRHHRFANEENDPDLGLASSLKTMPLWGIWPFLYVYDFLRNPERFPKVSPAQIRRELLIAAAIFGTLVILQPFYMLTLWLIPTYFAFFLMCLVFMVLPHYPHTGRQDENPHTTALLRTGQEWWLTPVLMYQNYHLVHHLYPTIPFYRYGKAWKAREAWHQEKSGSMVIGPFDLGPRAENKHT